MVMVREMAVMSEQCNVEESITVGNYLEKCLTKLCMVIINVSLEIIEISTGNC
jgi:hypothetical protein